MSAALYAGTSLAAEPGAEAPDAAESQRLAPPEKQEFLPAWRGYERYAWGHDEVQPLSKKPRSKGRLCS